VHPHQRAAPELVTHEVGRQHGDAVARESSRWTRTHDLVQQVDATAAAWLHGIVHIQEGDLEDTEYWHDRTSRDFRRRGSLAKEIAAFEAGSQDGQAAGYRPLRCAQPVSMHKRDAERNKCRRHEVLSRMPLSYRVGSHVACVVQRPLRGNRINIAKVPTGS
jgi:hypothetical protein